MHDASRAFGAEHTLVDGVIAVALDIGDFAFLHVDVDPTATGAHVAGRLPDLVRNFGREIDLWLVHVRLLSVRFLILLRLAER